MKKQTIGLFSIFLLILMIPLAHATTNNVVYSYSFDDDFHDNTGTNDLTKLQSFDNDTTISGLLFHLGNGSANFSTGNFDGLRGQNFTVPVSQSVTAWLNWTAAAVAQGYPIWSYENQSDSTNSRWEFYLSSNGTPSIDVRNGTAVTTYEVNGNFTQQDNWMFVGVTMNEAGQPLFYVNGVQRPSSNATPIIANSYPLGRLRTTFVGQRATFSSLATFRGNIDELNVWNKILTSADMAALYANGTGEAFPFSNINNQNFTVAYNSSENFAVTTKITMQENSSDFNYKYALSCNIVQEVLWNEVFNNFYNFTTQNVSTSFSSPESFLTFQGINWNNTVGVTPNFDLLKNANAAYRDYLLLQLQYQTNQDHYAEFITYDDSNNPGLYLILNKTGSLLIVDQYFPAFAQGVNIANFTLSGGNVVLDIQLTPFHDSGTNLDSFTFTIENANSSGVQTATTHQTIDGVETIQDVELFVGNRFNGTTLYKRIGLTRTNNPNPEFVEFQNGEREVIGGITFETHPPQSSVDGDGFTVIPDFNNVFYAICEYGSAVSVTQRHFMSPTASADDWSNFHDLLVTASQIATNTSTLPGTSGGAEADSFAAFFNSLFGGNISGVTVLAVLALLVVMIVSFVLFAFSRHAIFGVIGILCLIIIGFLVGFLPLWVILILVILAAGIMAVAYRTVFSGT